MENKDYIEIENYKFVKPKLSNYEICFIDDAGLIIGRVNNESCFWDVVSGKCFATYSNKRIPDYDLTIYHQQWHENENNYPCLCVVNDDIKVIKNKQTFDTYNSGNDFTIRLANKEDFKRYYYERD